MALAAPKPEAQAKADPYLLYGGNGLGYGYRHGYYGKRSADAEPSAEAAASREADPTAKTDVSREASPDAEADPSTEAIASRKGFLKVPEAKRNGRYGYPGYGYYNCPWYYYGYGCGSWWGKK